MPSLVMHGAGDPEELWRRYPPATPTDHAHRGVNDCAAGTVAMPGTGTSRFTLLAADNAL